MNVETKQVMTDEQMSQYGNALAVALDLKRCQEHSDRWKTAWGTKTGKGLYLTLQRMIENPHLILNKADQP